MPLLRNAICWKRARRYSYEKSVVSKIVESGQNVTIVPVSEVSSPRVSSPMGTPFSKLMFQT